MSDLDDLADFAAPTSPLTDRTLRKQKNRTSNGTIERHCCMCQKWLPIAEFLTRRRTMFITKPSIGHQAACKKCQIAYLKTHQGK